MDQPTSSLTRRDLLKLGGTALAVGATASASAPSIRRGPDARSAVARSRCARTWRRCTSTRT